MNRTMPPPIRRIARPGDIFLLLLPTAQELQSLREQQRLLQSRYGGKIVDFVHITCERFSPERENEEKGCLEYLKNNITRLSPFMLYADTLVQFFAPYWGEEVLRWQVQDTKEYVHLRKLLAASLHQTGCGSHFDRRKPTTCTALRLENKVEHLPQEPSGSFPIPLFKANTLLVSKLVRENEFDILAKILLEDQSFMNEVV